MSLSTSPSAPPASQVLLVTLSEPLLEEMLRLSAAAGVVLDVAHDAGAALRGWAAASVVFVGADLLAAVSAVSPLRRDDVHVVGLGAAPDALFRDALRIGAEQVVELPAAESWVVEVLTDSHDGARRRALTLGVVGGSGGAGATTFAAALALTAASASSPVTLVDADPLGGGVDRVVGFDQQPGVRWDSLTHSTGRLGSKSLRDALPERDGLAVLAHGSGTGEPQQPAQVREVVSATQRGSELVVIDAPRQLDPVSTELLARCDHVLLVTRRTLLTVAGAARVAARLREVCPSVQLVTRGAAAGLDAAEVARTLALPLLVQMEDQRRLTETVELGLGPVHGRRGPLARAARTVLERLGGARAAAS